MRISSRTGSGMPHRLSAAVDRACRFSVDARILAADVSDSGISDATISACAGGRIVGLPCDYLPCRCLSSAQNEATFDGSMILVGTIISLLDGMKDLLPSRYLAMSFIP